MTVHLRREADLGRIVLENPPANTLTRPDFLDAGELQAFLSDPGLRGVIVCGAGRHFCGGADIPALRAQASDPAAFADALSRGKALLQILADAPVPVVAEIRGQCLGAGLEIALRCHARIAADGAMFGFPESTLGVLPGFGGTVADGDRVERRVRMDLMLTGRLVGADEAHALGLVDRVVPGGLVAKAAREHLKTWIDGRSPALVHGLLEVLNNARRLARDEALRRETEVFLRLAREANP